MFVLGEFKVGGKKYVILGSVLAVTLADKYAPGRQRRFVGICIRREKTGLHHHFTLRNVVDGLGAFTRSPPRSRELSTNESKPIDLDVCVGCG